MEENRLFQLICKFLLINKSYSLVVQDRKGKESLIVNFCNCYDVDLLMLTCKDVGINIGFGELSSRISYVQEELKSISVGLTPMNTSLSESKFFVGECLKLNLKDHSTLILVKVESMRWWVAESPTDSVLRAKFVNFGGDLSANCTINLNGSILEVESVCFCTSTEKSRAIDRIMFPCFYSKRLEDISLEELLILPAYNMAKKLRQCGELNIAEWNVYLEKSHDYSINLSTAWLVANAVINNYDLLYT